MMRSYILGITKLVTPPPRLPQPPARALAEPTRGAVKSTDVQNWQGTNELNENPMMHLHTMKDAEELTRDMPNTAAADR
jgi:hypothetical protein